MSRWEITNCANHPDRIAVEQCEVCHKPLCAFCLYYTEDGQRLCVAHAEEAKLAGIRVEEPGAYADQLIGAQAGVWRDKRKRDQISDSHLYKGNSTDMMSLVGLLIGVIMLGACCSFGYCLPVVPLIGFLLSLVAVINAGKAYDKRRTRKFGLIGMGISGIWVLAVVGCIFLYGLTLQNAFTTWSFNSSSGNLLTGGATVTPTGTLATPAESATLDTTQTPEPTGSAQAVQSATP